ncbi:efflux RND transporter permease subunit [Rhodohalobacter sp.]|uniref:efflux RND transporter permease subunit n=1 Tax=Rhodohalobacter sp. TaxID=1974210 RepID=UPI002ACD3EEF|nr:efflux RND transporter permease subunit [Rhodohalobacter sp.]MDZ7758440.1 efflux RND transporter permease subunit [Rhodohalobacter sp.]
MKNLPKIAVNRPITFMMASIILIGFGLYGLNNLRLNLYPDVSFPTITVYTTFEGVAPEDIEALITRPIEEQVGSISGVRRVRSLSSQGSSVVKLNFNWGTDLFIAETEVRKRLDMIRRGLPDEVEQPIVFSYDPNDEPVLVLALTSDSRSPRELRTLATRQIEQRIERIEGIASAETAGGFDRQINVRISNAQMLTYNLDVGNISNRLRQENVQVPAGELTEGETVFSLRTIGDFKNIEEIRNSIVSVTDEGNPVYLKDIARVEDGIAQPIGNVRVQGNEGVIMNIYKQSDSNIVSAAGGVVNTLDEIRNVLPGDVSLEILTNKADFISLSINNLIMTGLQAVILVIIMLLLFLRNGRSALVVAITIPISIIATFSIMDFSNVSMNIISLSGLTLAVGMVVDNAVVVLENIFRFKEDGETSKVSAVSGAQEVAAPVIVSTLTTLVVFLPILFVPGIAGLLFRDLALTISFALIVSVLIAITLIPVLSSRLFDRELIDADKKDPAKNLMNKLLVWRRQNIFTRILAIPLFIGYFLLWPFLKIWAWIASKSKSFFSGRLGPALGRAFDRMENGYKNALDKSLKRSGLVVFGAFALLIASLPIYFLLGGEFFPQVDENFIILEVQREPGVSLLELERTIIQAENIIREEVPEARLIVSDYGDKIGIEGADNPGGNKGRIRIELVEVGDRDRSQMEIASSVLSSLNAVPGANIREIREDPLSPDGETGLIVQVYGFDQDVKRALASQVMTELDDIEGIVNVFSSADQGRPELRVEMDRERIARVGMTTSQVATSLSNAVQGATATTFVDEGIEFEVLVEIDPIDKAQSTSLEELQIQTPAGDWMPLKNLARIERYTGPSNILRVNQERMVEVEGDLGSIDLQTATELANAAIGNIDFPEGYRYELGGSAEEQRESFFYLMIAFLIAGILTYMVMASQFESLVEPFIIIVTIPLALTGVLLMLWITSTPISVTAMVGLVLLTGIVVNNGIVMIDYIKILQSRGQNRHDAIVNGAGRRLRPILMTAFTTILAMVPLALQLGAGAETWSPMARAVIGGLTMSTILMLFAVPCMYNLINSLVEKAGFDAIHKEDPLKV